MTSAPHAASPAPPSPSLSVSDVGSGRWPVWLLSGALAGLSVDCVLFPLDTIKTRMQSKHGLRGAGGFGKLFAGVASAAAGSAPTAALFFFTYESSKAVLTPLLSGGGPSPSRHGRGDAPAPPLVHCLSASLGETVACLVRVPTENVKQKVQAGQYASSFQCFKAMLHTAPAPGAYGAAAAAAAGASPSPAPAARSPFRNFYRGFGTTIMREIPFAFIQFPLYEWGKHWLARTLAQRRHARQLHSGAALPSSLPPPVELSGWQCACMGSLAGGVAAALTTPLDVIKTRLMLQAAHGEVITSATGVRSTAEAPLGLAATVRSVYADGGIPRFFSGVVPRVLWISVGGFVFFGAYEGAKQRLMRVSAFRE